MPLFFYLLLATLTYAQDEVGIGVDSMALKQLDEVTVMGESQVMSLSKKLFSVEVLDRKDIAKVAGNNLADMLNYNLNITITPDASTGRSTINMFGLDGQYSKVLLDGIPMASDNGFGNNVDITQINLEDVERVEIVEGAMGVLYGDNAVAGVINIVTKRGLDGETWQVQASIQEETVGSEYNLSDEGRHIQNFKVTNLVNDDFSYTLGASRNDYAGFYNTFRGKDYVNIQDNTVINDTLRGTEWNPKEQLTVFANANVNLDKHNFFYKFQYFDEQVTVYDRFITGLIENGALTATATDENFLTDRFVNNLTVSGPLSGQTNYNLFFSQQSQKRYYQDYTYDILAQGIRSYNIDVLSQSSEIWYTKGFVSNIVPKPDFFNLQLGYEFIWQTGFDAIATGDYSNDVVENHLDNYDFFGVADFNLTKKLSLYPGARVTNNSQFGNQFIWSLSSTYKISEKLDAKGTVGSAFRAPNFEELFFYFVDANHNVRGNPDLQPEDGISIFLNLGNKQQLSQKRMLKTNLQAYYFDIVDKIDQVQTEDENGQNLTTYQNVDNSKIAGVALRNSLVGQNWRFGLNSTYMGESTIISESENVNPDYLWSFNIESTLSYTVPLIKTTFSGLLKYTGKTQVLLEGFDGSTVLGQTDAFTWMDASFKTDITNDFSITLGTRNIFNVVTVNATDVPAAGHDGAAPTSRLFGNGRSYFLKLAYNLNFN